jgi:hypothetical protein
MTMISKYHKDELCVVISKVDYEGIKPVGVCYYGVNMLEVNLKDQML